MTPAFRHAVATWKKIQAASDLGEVYDVVDKTKWPEGPWTKEPDIYVFRHDDIWCAMRRMPVMGHWTGYVAVTVSHPWYGREAYNIAAKVHGGVEYAEVDEINPGGWVVGWDANHYQDHCPGMGLVGEYRTAGFAYEETLRLARQAEAAATTRVAHIVEIEDWAVVSVAAEDAFKAPEQSGIALKGHVTGHPNKPDGSLVITSPIAACKGRLVATEAGTTYRLHAPENGYRLWLRANRPDWDPENPVQIKS
jgi:hypothetical protein